MAAGRRLTVERASASLGDVEAPALAATAQAPATPRERLRRFLALDLLDNRYPALHGLRVLAILTVIQWHVTWIVGVENGVVLDREFVDQSLALFFGMDLFFILSGFLIGSILLRSVETAGSQQLQRFYVRRIFRTFPSYWIVLTILALGTKLTSGQRANLPFEYLYLTNFRPLGRDMIVMFWGWSLSLEEQFYLTVPLLLFALTRLRSDRGRIALLGGLWLIPLALRLTIYLRGRPWDDLALYSALYFRTATRFDTLIAGVLLALVHRRWGKAIAVWLQAPLHRAMLALPSLSCLWLLLFPTMFGQDNVQPYHVFAWGSLTSLMYLPALTLLLHSEGAISHALSAPIFRRVATLGYGVYLVHIPLIDHLAVPAAHWLDGRHVPRSLIWIVSMAGVCALSWAIGYLLHVLVEKPSLRVRDRLAA